MQILHCKLLQIFLLFSYLANSFWLLNEGWYNLNYSELPTILDFYFDQAFISTTYSYSPCSSQTNEWPFTTLLAGSFQVLFRHVRGLEKLLLFLSTRNANIKRLFFKPLWFRQYATCDSTTRVKLVFGNYFYFR